MLVQYVTGFVMLVSAIIGLFLPITEGIYDFQTDLREDSHYAETAVGQTSVNVTLQKVLYDNDTSTIDIYSDLNTDLPVFASYNTTTRAMQVNGLTANASRTFTVGYDVAAFTSSVAINNVLEQLPWWWMLLIIMMPAAGIGAMWLNARRRR